MIKENKVILRENKKPITLDVSFINNNKPKPVIVFCHGYKGFKDWGCWDLFASEIASKDAFFLKFNFSHNGGTVEQLIDFPDLKAFGENNFTTELDDLDAVISWVLNVKNEFQSEINGKDITLIGHSRGGGMVVLKASEDKRITKLITLAGVSDYKSRFPVGEELAYWKREGVAYIENARTKQQMPHYIQFYDDFIANEERLTISRAAKELKIPHLIIHGTNDETVTFREAERLHDWSAKSKLFAIENANHVFGSSHPWKENALPEDLRLALYEVLAFI